MAYSIAQDISIGNDIVDLKASNSPQNTRFKERVFDTAERERIGTSEVQLWHYWAAKEAAYKALKRVFPALVFSPREFIYDHEQALLRSPYGTVHCTTIINEDFVHVLCRTTTKVEYGNSNEAVEVWISKDDLIVDNPDEQFSASSKIRSFATRKIAKLLEIEEDRIGISKNPKGGLQHSSIPYLLIDRQFSEHLLSFSHDGGYLACALYPRPRQKG